MELPYEAIFNIRVAPEGLSRFNGDRISLYMQGSMLEFRNVTNAPQIVMTIKGKVEEIKGPMPPNGYMMMPMYGQPPMGYAPPYGQPMYGQPMQQGYGQPVYGQPQYPPPPMQGFGQPNYQPVQPNYPQPPQSPYQPIRSEFQQPMQNVRPDQPISAQAEQPQGGISLRKEDAALDDTPSDDGLPK